MNADLQLSPGVTRLRPDDPRVGSVLVRYLNEALANGKSQVIYNQQGRRPMMLPMAKILQGAVSPVNWGETATDFTLLELDKMSAEQKVEAIHKWLDPATAAYWDKWAPASLFRSRTVAMHVVNDGTRLCPDPVWYDMIIDNVQSATSTGSEARIVELKPKSKSNET